MITVDVEFTSPSKTDENLKERIFKIAASIQIATTKKVYFIDTLVLCNKIKKHLGPILENPKILKIFHSCEGDINVLY